MGKALLLTVIAVKVLVSRKLFLSGNNMRRTVFRGWLSWNRSVCLKAFIDGDCVVKNPLHIHVCFILAEVSLVLVLGKRQE